MLPPTQIQLYQVFELDFDVIFPLLRFLLFLSDLKSATIRKYLLNFFLQALEFRVKGVNYRKQV